jgi:RNA polymerase sigma factor (sigma-70 family)
MDSSTQYYNEICKMPLMKREEEEQLFAEYYRQDTSESRRKEIRDKIIQSNLRFVFKTARNFAKNELGLFPDLISAGNEGLLVGFDKYNPSSGVKFLSYAGWWVQQRILISMSKVRIVALPVWKQQLATKLQRFRENNEDITLEQLKSEFPDVPEKDISELYNTRYLTYYLGDLDQDSPEFEYNPVEDLVESTIDAETIRKALAELPTPYREIVGCTFGLAGDKIYKPHHLAKKLGLPKDLLETLLEEGLSMLRENLGVNIPQFQSDISGDD